MTKNIKTILTVCLFSTLFGCATQQMQKKQSKPTGLNSLQNVKPSDLSRRIKEEQKQDLKDKNLVLAKRNAIHGIKTQAKRSVIQVSPRASEDQLYRLLIQCYDSGDAYNYNRIANVMIQRFPNGYYIDEALYLAGIFSLSQKKYELSIKYFNWITSKYPNSNKANGAYFALASTYKKMNLNEQAKEVYQMVKSKYPGSPESYRAEAELVLIK